MPASGIGTQQSTGPKFSGLINLTVAHPDQRGSPTTGYIITGSHSLWPTCLRTGGPDSLEHVLRCRSHPAFS
jgi:hypothetical protein